SGPAPPSRRRPGARRCGSRATPPPRRPRRGWARPGSRSRPPTKDGRAWPSLKRARCQLAGARTGLLRVEARPRPGRGVQRAATAAARPARVAGQVTWSAAADGRHRVGQAARAVALLLVLVPADAADEPRRLAGGALALRLLALTLALFLALPRLHRIDDLPQALDDRHARKASTMRRARR